MKLEDTCLKKKAVETCEMCSAEIYRPVTIKVEGALLTVCDNCTSFGNIVEKPRSRVQIQSSSKGSAFQTTRSGMKSSPRKNFKSRQDSSEKELINDFANIVRSARMKQKINQEQLATMTGLSIPFIKSIEAGKTRPTDVAAKKLERELKIELLFSPEAELDYSEKSKSKSTTLGDIAVIRKFEYDDD